MEKQEKFTGLFQKLLNNECSPEEVDQIVSWIAADKRNEAGKQLVFDQLSAQVSETEIDESIRQRLKDQLEAILLNSKPVYKGRLIGLKFWKYAAAILVLISVAGFYFLLNNQSKGQKAQDKTFATVMKNDILPGGNRAILTLANGSRIELDSLKKGMLAQQGSANVVQLNPGEISYYKSGDTADKKPIEIMYNTITTPRGGQYQVVLPDGSMVWLNAASSLKFPTVFEGNDRKVELTGEGYFEIAKNAAMPFKVSVNNTIVEVLGTHFNVNAYTDEAAMKTTLLEGAVKVYANGKTQLLKPGEQLSLKKNGLEKVFDNVNTEQVLAWKNGLFDFSDVELRTIGQQLSRWYQVDISFENNVPDKHISGIISRKNNISTVLQMLEFTAGIHSRIEGAKVVFYK
ncbi:MAG: FecR family protein [Bacteroidetes bacterium]|nr:FecR family protein [Bacteroidota bacterium]